MAALPPTEDSPTRFSFTCILMANQLGSDSAPVPIPVHLDCWESYGQRNGYTRIKGAKQFVVKGQWRHSIPDATICRFCQTII